MANTVVAPSPPASGDESEAKQAGRIRGFDGLRGIAFLLVFISHKVYFAHADSVGDIGVWLFFVLSGFLITRILARSRSEIENGSLTVYDGLRGFYVRRTARIFPPYYSLLMILAIISLFVPIDNFGPFEKTAYFLYGTNILIAASGHWIGDFGHFWSLAIEEQFYLVFAPLVLLTPRRHTAILCLAMVALGIVTKIVLELANASSVAIDVNSLVNFALIGMGGIIGLNAGRPAPKWLTGGLAQFAVLCLYMALPAAFGTWPFFWPLLGKVSAVLVGVLLFQIFKQQQSGFVTVLESAPLRNVGRVSYGAYLIHHFLHFSAIESLLQQLGVVTTPRPVQVLAELAASLILAAVSWRYVEKPIIAMAKRTTSSARSVNLPNHAP
jgi:peptidoglycan/LPS O-acetylase OafA/YrhL